MKKVTPASIFSISTMHRAFNHIKASGIRKYARHVCGILMHRYRYRHYASRHQASKKELIGQAATVFPYQPLISIIVPTYRTPKDYLIQMIESVTAQSYHNWELCIADGSPDHSPAASIVREYQKSFPSIHFRALDKNLGIAGNTNAALELASGDYIALLDHDDFLAPNALYELVQAINSQKQADILYTDEDKYDSRRKRYYEPIFKPDFDPEYLLSCNYITHFYVVRKSIADEVQGFSEKMDGSQDYDFILRTTEKSSHVIHIAKILYHWRIHDDSVAGNPESKMYAYDAAIKALDSHYERFHIPAKAEPTVNLGFYRTSYKLQGQPLVSIIMKNCDSTLREEILHKSDYEKIEFVSRWSEVRGEYVLFLSELSGLSIESSWLTDLIANCQRPEIGAVSGKILYPEDKIYEFGLIYDKEGNVVSPFFNHASAYPGYYFLTESQHAVSLAGGHFLMAAKEDVDRFICQKKPKKLDEAFAYDLCLMLRGVNKTITVLPYMSAVLNRKAHRSCHFYKFDRIPNYILSHPHDPLYNKCLSIFQPYEIV